VVDLFARVPERGRFSACWLKTTVSRSTMGGLNGLETHKIRASLFLKRRNRAICIANTIMDTTKAPRNLVKLIPSALCALPADPSTALFVADDAELVVEPLGSTLALDVMLPVAEESDADKDEANEDATAEVSEADIDATVDDAILSASKASCW
jgi:hypothetical protein